MKMKELICVLFIGLALGCLRGQSPSPAEWKVNLGVVDDEDRPVPGALAWVAYGTPKEGESLDPLPSNGWSVGGMTDTNGLFTASHRDTAAASLGLHIQKAGYYPVVVVYELGTSYDPQRWNLSPTWVLKRIRHPIAMWARRIDSGPPVNGKAVGYDLTTGDWVAPQGKGRTADFVFLKDYRKRSLNDYDYKVTVSFVNPGDGIQEFRVPATRFVGDGSSLRSPYEAPEKGYQAKVTRLNVSHPGQPLIFDYDENRNYFFRVRTVLDENGNVVSALYGKIYGDFMHSTYYLNPTPNDRNVEFDAKHNLLTGLKSFEQVTAP